MYNICNVLNRIGDFFFQIREKKLELTGTLIKKDNNVILEARTVKENLKYIREDNNRAFQICGIVSGIEVTLLNCVASVQYIFDDSVAYGNISADPTEIIIGRSSLEDIEVKKISASIEALNYMFSERLFNENVRFSKENPSILEFAYPKEIEAYDSDGGLCLYRTFQHSWSWDKIEYSFLPNIEYTFSKQVKIRDAISKLASARNLLSFFADYYLPLENISFADEQTETIDGCEVFCDCYLHMNHADSIESLQRPFLIMTDKFSENFSAIWNNWVMFYSDSIYIPTLFFEIISNRSTRINRFLNLTQAIELYSNYYRQTEASNTAKADGCNKSEIPLKYRIEDVLLYLDDCLDLEIETRRRLATVIGKDRNFFTHYNKQRYNEPSVQEVLAANRVLRYVLLSIVYKTIGIESTDVKACNHFEYSTLSRDIEVILKDKKDVEYTSWSE